MNFPGHKYLGPGNSSHQGTPVDNDDAIALEHDLAYDDAKTEKDVRVADRKAIKHFTGDLVTTGNWHSAVGAAGLTAKYSVESVTGVVYPIVESSPEGADNEAGLIAEGKKVVKEKVDVIIEPVRDFKDLPTEKKWDSAVRVAGSATKFTAEKISEVVSSHSDNKDDSSDSPEKENLESNEESEGHSVIEKGKKVMKKKLDELAEPILGDKNLSTPEKLENAVIAAGTATKYTAGVIKGVISPLIHKEDTSGSSPEK